MSQPYTNFKDGNATLDTAGTRKQLSTTSIPCGKVTITASENNGGDIVVGGGTVVGANDTTRRGTTLTQGAAITLEVDDLSKVWFDGTNTGDTIHYSYLF